jgi:hypothetical protein
MGRPEINILFLYCFFFTPPASLLPLHPLLFFPASLHPASYSLKTKKERRLITTSQLDALVNLNFY